MIKSLLFILYTMNIVYLDHMFSIISSIAIIVATILGLSIGSVWKKQDKDIKEKGISEDIELKKIWRNNELCIKAIKSLKTLENNINYFRTPAMFGGEIKMAYEDLKIDREEEKNAVTHKDEVITYRYRWKKVSEALVDFESIMIEIRIIFEEIDISSLIKKINELVITLNDFNNNYEEIKKDKAWLNRVRNVLGMGINEDREEFGNELKSLIKYIEDNLSKNIIK